MRSLIISITAMIIFSTVTGAAAPVATGADILVARRLDLLQGKRVGLITNHTGKTSSGQFLLDALLEHKITIVALFGPEHGIRGVAGAGEKVENGTDPQTGIPVFSLYGKNTKPTPEMLKDVDLLLYDIQDAGARFYTYISTMTLCMQAAAEKGIPFVLLDRPNPLGGTLMDGPIREDSLKSFVGLVPVPVVYGLTLGELARMVNGEHWLGDSLCANLTVVEMEGWKRGMQWEDTGVPWVNPSPNLRSPNAMRAYPATCFLEGTNVSEGRGGPDPFVTVGAPYIQGPKLADAMNARKLPGVKFTAASYTPSESKFKGQPCQGVSFEITDAVAFRPVSTGIELIGQIMTFWPDQLKLNESWLNKLMGSGEAIDMLAKRQPAAKIAETWRASVDEFRTRASKYFLYK